MKKQIREGVTGTSCFVGPALHPLSSIGFLFLRPIFMVPTGAAMLFHDSLELSDLNYLNESFPGIFQLGTRENVKIISF